MSLPNKPLKIRIMRDAYTKFFYYIQKCDKEIGFMGKTVFNPEHMSYDILSVYVPKQEVTGATTDLDAQDVAHLESATFKEKGHLNAWLHSHVNMGVFWSGTDNATIKEIGEQGLCVAIVGNKKKEMRGAIYFKGVPQDKQQDGFFPSFPTEAFYDDVKIEVIDRVLASEVAEWDKVFEANVKEKKWTAPKNYVYDGDVDDHYGYGRKWSERSAAGVNEDGVIPLSRRERKKLERARQKAEKEKGSQMTLLGDDTPTTATSGGYSKLSQPLYTDVELYNMTYTELASELRHMKAQGFIDANEEDEIITQWRTCNLRINDVANKVVT